MTRCPRIGIREIDATDAVNLVNYWAEATDTDLERMEEASRPDSAGTIAFIEQLCRERPSPRDADEGILIWTVEATPIGYSTLKSIRYGEDAQVHLHMWDRHLRGKGYGAALFCLSTLEFRRRFELKALYCQPKADNPMPNRMLRRIGFPEMEMVQCKRRDGVSITQSRFVIDESVARRYLDGAHGKFLFESELKTGRSI